MPRGHSAPERPAIWCPAGGIDAIQVGRDGVRADDEPLGDFSDSRPFLAGTSKGISTAANARTA